MAELTEGSETYNIGGAVIDNDDNFIQLFGTIDNADRYVRINDQDGVAYQVPGGMKLQIFAAKFVSRSASGSLRCYLGYADAVGTETSTAPTNTQLAGHDSGAAGETCFITINSGGDFCDAPVRMNVAASKYPIVYNNTGSVTDINVFLYCKLLPA